MLKIDGLRMGWVEDGWAEDRLGWAELRMG